MKKSLLILSLIAIALSACSSTSDPSKALQLSKELQYIKDPRTGFCFATRWPTSNAAVLATVPCTPEVEGLLVTQ